MSSEGKPSAKSMPQWSEVTANDLDDAFEKALAVLPESRTEAKAHLVIGLIMDLMLLKKGVQPGSLEAEAIEAGILTEMALWDSDDPSLSTVEKIFRRFGTGDAVGAITLLQTSVDQKRQRQATIARKPRNRLASPLTQLVRRIVEGNPKIRLPELLDSLNEEVGKGVISKIEGDLIYPEQQGGHEDAKPVSRDQLSRRLSTIKKRLMSR